MPCGLPPEQFLKLRLADLMRVRAGLPKFEDKLSDSLDSLHRRWLASLRIANSNHVRLNVSETKCVQLIRPFFGGLSGKEN